MKTESTKDKSPERQLTPRPKLGHAAYPIAAFTEHKIGAFLGEGFWGRPVRGILGLVLDSPPEEDQATPLTQRVLEAELVEGQIKTSVMKYFAGATTYVSTPPSADVIAEKLNEVCERLSRIERALEDAVKGIEWLRTRDRTIWVPIDSLAPEPFELLRPITVVVTSAGDEFEASFFDANLHGAGDTEEEAISDLKAVVIEAFDRLSAIEDEKLGPAMVKQKHVLRGHIRKGGE